MESHSSDSSTIAGAKSDSGSLEGPRDTRDSSSRSAAKDAPDKSIGSVNATKIRRLIADKQYFGMEALAFHDGAARVLARVATQERGRATIDIRSLGADFRLDPAASRRLLHELIYGGLVQQVGSEGYRPTTLFREYARACVVAPLSRERAKTLIDRARELSARINADLAHNPYQIQALAVSGSYMSRCDPLPELSLWLVFCKRPPVRERRRRPSLTQDAALRQIVARMKALSSYVIVKVVEDYRQAVPRPFAVIFEADRDAMNPPTHVWETFGELGAAVRRSLALR